MDPNATIQRIKDALPGDIEEFLAACDDLAGWLMGKGFVPSRINEITNKHLLLLGIHGKVGVVDILRDARGLAALAEKGVNNG